MPTDRLVGVAQMFISTLSSSMVEDRRKTGTGRECRRRRKKPKRERKKIGSSEEATRLGGEEGEQMSPMSLLSYLMGCCHLLFLAESLVGGFDVDARSTLLMPRMVLWDEKVGSW